MRAGQGSPPVIRKHVERDVKILSVELDAQILGLETRILTARQKAIPAQGIVIIVMQEEARPYKRARLDRQLYVPNVIVRAQTTDGRVDHPRRSHEGVPEAFGHERVTEAVVLDEVCNLHVNSTVDT